MTFDRQQAMFYMVVVLIIVMAFVAVQVWQIARDVNPIANSPIVRGLSGLGAGLSA